MPCTWMPTPSIGTWRRLSRSTRPSRAPALGSPTAGFQTSSLRNRRARGSAAWAERKARSTYRLAERVVEDVSGVPAGRGERERLVDDVPDRDPAAVATGDLAGADTISLRSVSRGLGEDRTAAGPSPGAGGGARRGCGRGCAGALVLRPGDHAVGHREVSDPTAGRQLAPFERVLGGDRIEAADGVGALIGAHLARHGGAEGRVGGLGRRGGDTQRRQRRTPPCRPAPHGAHPSAKGVPEDPSPYPTLLPGPPRLSPSTHNSRYMLSGLPWPLLTPNSQRSSRS